VEQSRTCSRSRAGEAFVANIAAAAALLGANARGAALGKNPGYLHQVRVGIRRLRSTLRVFRRLVRKRPARRFDHALRSLMRAWARRVTGMSSWTRTAAGTAASRAPPCGRGAPHGGGFAALRAISRTSRRAPELDRFRALEIRGRSARTGGAVRAGARSIGCTPTCELALAPSTGRTRTAAIGCASA
jgi:inorganic triphosphatase YgiF